MTTLRDRYGEQAAQDIPDDQWIKDASGAGEILLTKDYAIRHNPLFQEAMRKVEARGFCLPNGNMTAVEMRWRFLAHLNRIIQRAQQRGPYMYGVYHEGLGLLWPLDRNLSRR